MSSISPLVRTSRVFDATLSLFDRLSEMSFPSAPTSQRTPSVHLAVDPQDTRSEYVVVVVNEDETLAEWIEAGPASREERFSIDVVIGAKTPLQFSERDLVVWLEQVADIVQSVAYDTTEGKPKAIGFDNERRVGQPQTVSFRIVRGPNGLLGEALVRFALVAQI